MVKELLKTNSFKMLLWPILSVVISSCVPGPLEQEGEEVVVVDRDVHKAITVEVAPGTALGNYSVGSDTQLVTMTITNNTAFPYTRMDMVFDNNGNGGFKFNPASGQTDGTYPGDGGTCGETLAGKSSCFIRILFNPDKSANFSQPVIFKYTDLFGAKTVSRTFSALVGTDASLFFTGGTGVFDLEVEERTTLAYSVVEVEIQNGGELPATNLLLNWNVSEQAFPGYDFVWDALDAANDPGENLAYYGSLPGGWEIQNNSCLDLDEIASGQSCTLRVAFYPTNSRYYPVDPLDDPPLTYTGAFSYLYQKNPTGSTGNISANFSVISIGIEGNFTNPSNDAEVQVDFADTTVGNTSPSSGFLFNNTGFNDGIPQTLIFTKGNKDPWDSTAHVIAICEGTGTPGQTLSCYKCLDGALKTNCIGPDSRNVASFPNAFTEPLNNKRIFPFEISDGAGCMGSTVAKALPDGTPGGTCSLSAVFKPSFDAFDNGTSPDTDRDYEYFYSLKYDSQWKDNPTFRFKSLGFFRAKALNKARLIISQSNGATGGFLYGNEAVAGTNDLIDSDLTGQFSLVSGDIVGALFRNNSGTCWEWNGSTWVTPTSVPNQFNCLASNLCGGGQTCSEDQFSTFDPRLNNQDSNFLYQYRLGAVAMVNSNSFRERIRITVKNVGGSTATNFSVQDALGNNITTSTTGQLGGTYYYDVIHNCTALAPDGSCNIDLFLSPTSDTNPTVEYGRFLDTSIVMGTPPSGWKTLNIGYDHGAAVEDDNTPNTSQTLSVQWSGTLVQKGYLVLNIDDNDPGSPPVDGQFNYLVTGETDTHDIQLTNVGTGPISYIFLDPSFGGVTLLAQHNRVTGTTIGDRFDDGAGTCFLWDGSTWNNEGGCGGPATAGACNGSIDCTQAAIGIANPGTSDRLYLSQDGDWSAFSVVPSGAGNDCFDMVYWTEGNNPPNTIDGGKVLPTNQSCTLRVKVQQLLGSRRLLAQGTAGTGGEGTSDEWDLNLNAQVTAGVWEFNFNTPAASPIDLKFAYYDGASPVIIPDGDTTGVFYKNNAGECWEYRQNPETTQKNWVPTQVLGDADGVVYINSAGNQFTWSAAGSNWVAGPGGGDETTAAMACNGGFRCAEDVFGIVDPASANGQACTAVTASNACSGSNPCNETQTGVAEPGVKNSLLGSLVASNGVWRLSASFLEEAKLVLEATSHASSNCWSSHIIRRDYSLPEVIHPQLYHLDMADSNLRQAPLALPSYQMRSENEVCYAAQNREGEDHLDGTVHYVIYGGAVLTESGVNTLSYDVSATFRNLGNRNAEITSFGWVGGDTEIDFVGATPNVSDLLANNGTIPLTFRFADPDGQPENKKVYTRTFAIHYKNGRSIGSDEVVQKQVKVVFEAYKKGDFPYLTAKYQPYDISYDPVLGYSASTNPVAFLKPLDGANFFQSSDGNCYSFDIPSQLWVFSSVGDCSAEGASGGTVAGCDGNLNCNSATTGLVDPNTKPVGLGLNGAAGGAETIAFAAVNDPSGNGNHGIARVRVWIENPSGLDITDIDYYFVESTAMANNKYVNGTLDDEHSFTVNTTDFECHSAGTNKVVSATPNKCYIDINFRAILPTTKTVYVMMTYLLEDEGGNKRYFTHSLRLTTEGRPPAKFQFAGLGAEGNSSLNNLEYLYGELTTNVPRYQLNLGTGWEANLLDNPTTKSIKVVGSYHGAVFFSSSDPENLLNWHTAGTCYTWNSSTHNWDPGPGGCSATDFEGYGDYSGRPGGGCATLIDSGGNFAADYDLHKFVGGEGCSNAPGAHPADNNFLMRVSDPNDPITVVYQTFSAGPYTVTHSLGATEKASFLAMFYDSTILTNEEIRKARNQGKISKVRLADFIANNPAILGDRSLVIIPIFDDGKRRAYANAQCLWGATDTISSSLTAEVGFVTPGGGTCQVRFEFDVDPVMARMAFNSRVPGDAFDPNKNLTNLAYSLLTNQNGIGIEYWAYKRQTTRRTYFTVSGHFSADNVEAQTANVYENRAFDQATIRVTFDMPAFDYKAGQAALGSVVNYNVFQSNISSNISRTKDHWLNTPQTLTKAGYDGDTEDFFLTIFPGSYNYWQIGAEREVTSNGLTMRYRTETDMAVGKMLMPPSGTVMRWDETNGKYWLVDIGFTTPEPFGVDRDEAIADCDTSNYSIYIEDSLTLKQKTLISKEVWDWIYADSSRSSYDPDLEVKAHWFSDASVQLDDALFNEYGCNPGDPGCGNIYDANTLIGFDLPNKLSYFKPCADPLDNSCDEVYEMFGYNPLPVVGHTFWGHNEVAGGSMASARCYWEIDEI